MYRTVLTLHIVSVVLMAAPYYNLVIVSERARFGQTHVQVDRYFEAIIKGILFRCYFIAWTTLLLGLLLVALRNEWNFAPVLTNGFLLIKTLAWIAIMGVHNIVYFGIQPRIDRLLQGIEGDAIPGAAAPRLLLLRARRKQGAAACLFLVFTSVVMGLQVFSPLSLAVTLALVAGALLFAWWVYRSGAPYGWV